MAVRALSASLLLVASVVLAGAQSVRPTAPESFRAQGQVLGTAGGVAAEFAIQIDRYTADVDHQAVADALKQSGYPAFLEKLRALPVAGTLKVANRSIAVRWAREQDQGSGRRIVLITDAPVFFFGGGAVDAKPTEGYDVAVVELTVDSVGLGKGSLAPAARVKPGGPAGVQIEEYAGKLITLNTVARNVR